MKNPEKVVEHIVEWLNSYALESNMKGFVVGVSGGIDSAVTSTLCALSGRPVIALEMPIHQGSNQVNRAKEHLEWLTAKFANVHSNTIQLTGLFEAFKEVLPPTENKQKHHLSLANTRAQFRMST